MVEWFVCCLVGCIDLFFCWVVARRMLVGRLSSVVVTQLDQCRDSKFWMVTTTEISPGLDIISLTSPCSNQLALLFATGDATASTWMTA